MKCLLKDRKTQYLVTGTTYVFKFFIWTVVPGTKWSQKIFENFLGSKKEDLVPG
jgi:hypothetical protein